MRYRWYAVGVVCAIALVWGGVSYWQRERGLSSGNDIMIGAVLPLTGDSAQWGIPARNAAQLALDQINSNGGISGHQLRIDIQDDVCQPRNGVSAFNKIMAADSPPAVLGAVCSSVTLAIAPLAETDKVVLISPASTTPKLTSAGDYIFRDIPSDSLRGRVFADYLYRTRHTKSVAILYINNEGGVGNRDSFKARFEQDGGQVPLEEAYAQDATDVRTQITEIKSSGVDAVMVVSYPQDTVTVLRQVKELQLNKPLYFQTEAVEDPNVLREAADAANGVIYILPASPAGAAPQTFAAAYQAKFGHKPELFAAESYDAVNLLADAMKAAKGRDISSTEIGDYLRQVRNYAGASGTITFDRSGDVTKPYAIKIVRNGHPETLSTLD
jgi:branched-chain amino acid transport system substrate-binding protein